MTIYTFQNENTGRIKVVEVFAYYEALQKCKSENGWKLKGFCQV